MEQYLWDGEYGEAVELFLELVDTLCEHFVADEHWCWFDDSYWPGDDADRCWEMLRDRLQRMSEEVFDRLEEGLMDSAGTEAYEVLYDGSVLRAPRRFDKLSDRGLGDRRLGDCGVVCPSTGLGPQV